MPASSSPIDAPEFDGDWLSSPPAPEAAHWDDASCELVLSRHGDVLAALREPNLYQVSRDGDLDSARRREGRRLKVRADLAAMLTRAVLADHRARMAELARSTLERLPVDQPVDLLRQFVQPWSTALALALSGTSEAHATQLVDLQERLAGTEAERLRAQEALKHFFRQNGTPAAESVFMGTADTLPRFLANAILALLRHPAEFARLRAQPDLMPAAIEELLRYGGLVHTLYRRAAGDAVCSGIAMATDSRVALRPALGNRDPQSFPEPNRLDLARRAPGHLSLGAGPHSCVGAALVRMAIGVVLEALVEQGAAWQLAGAIEWRSGSMLFSPVALPVIRASH